jgi:riboflavin kinase/FMN adenylyltransferase
LQVISGHQAVAGSLSAAALAIGNFDGVHRGHQELLRRAVAFARAHGIPAVALTFDPHPASVLSPGEAPPPLSSQARKLEWFAAAGIDVCVIEPFTAAFARVSADDFMDQVLPALRVRHVVVGADFRYGRGRGGSCDHLRQRGAVAGFSVDVVEPIVHHGVRVSSSEIRRLLLVGDVARAATLLGRAYELAGVVEHGAARGRTLGFPTANLASDVPPCVAPGIYATWAEVDGRRWMAATSVGMNPTFSGERQTVEAHLLDFEGHLYGKRLRLEFARWLRPEQKFASAEALVAQITLDIGETRQALSAHRGMRE